MTRKDTDHLQNLDNTYSLSGVYYCTDELSLDESEDVISILAGLQLVYSSDTNGDKVSLAYHGTTTDTCQEATLNQGLSKMTISYTQ